MIFICMLLQEVETEQYWSFFLPELKKNGYEGIFTPKSRAKTMTEEERRYVDGCAIFWHSSKFKLIKEHVLEFNQVAASLAEGADDMVNRVMQRDNICIMAQLECVDAVPELNNIKPTLIVANAHIHWDPEFRDVKVIQSVLLMRELKQFASQCANETSLIDLEGGKATAFKTPVVICADMNSMVDSGAIEFMENGKIPVLHSDFQKLQYGGFLNKLSEKEKKGDEVVTHPFKLCRVAKENELPFTNFTYDFCGVLDYIFYTKDEFVPLGELGPVDYEYLKKNKVIGFPHPHFPSDHICLVVEFDFHIPQSLR